MALKEVDLKYTAHNLITLIRNITGDTYDYFFETLETVLTDGQIKLLIDNLEKSMPMWVCSNCAVSLDERSVTTYGSTHCL